MMNFNLTAKKTGIDVGTRIWRLGLACLLVLASLTCMAAETNQPAQSGPVMQPERWLLIFDTSSAMKKRLPALTQELTQIFASNMGDRLHSGDSVAVWTFNDTLHAGQYPLMAWDPTAAMVSATNVMAFVEKQDFKGRTQFDVLDPTVREVIHTSQRLTVLIFADGDGAIEGTPYDDGINANLQAGASERKKHKEPVVITMRTQEGKFIGATVNYPPTALNLQSFPPLPERVKETPPPEAVQTNVPPPPAPPVVELPPLIMVGKSTVSNTHTNPAINVSNTTATITDAGPPEIATNEMIIAPPVEEPSNPPVVKAVVQSSQVPAPIVAETPTETNELATTLITNLPVLASWANGGSTTNQPKAAVPGNNLDRSTVILLAVGGGFLGVAVALVAWLLFRRRAPRTSIITKLMSEDPRFRR